MLAIAKASKEFEEAHIPFKALVDAQAIKNYNSLYQKHSRRNTKTFNASEKFIEDRAGAVDLDQAFQQSHRPSRGFLGSASEDGDGKSMRSNSKMRKGPCTYTKSASAKTNDMKINRQNLTVLKRGNPNNKFTLHRRSYMVGYQAKIKRKGCSFIQSVQSGRTHWALVPGGRVRCALVA